MSSDSYFTKFTTPSGLRVYYCHTGVPWFHAAIELSVGHRDDPLGKEGTAHLLEHQLSSGTQGLPSMSPAEFKDWLEEQRFDLNHGGTTIDVTTYAGKAEVYRAREFFDFFHRFVFLPRLDIGFEHDRQIVRNERIDRYSLRGREAVHVKDRAVFGSHRLATTDGCPDDQVLDALTSDDVRAMHQRYYHYRNAVMVVMGGLDAADLKRALCGTFTLSCDDRTTRPQPAGISFELPCPNTYHSVLVGKDRESVLVTYVWHLSPLSQRHVHGLVLLRNALNKLLNDRLRFKDELVYGVSVRASFTIDHVVFKVSAKVTPEKIDRTRAVIEHTMRDVEGVRAILDDCRKGTVLSILFEDRTVSDQIDEAMHHIEQGWEPISPQVRARLFECMQERDLRPFVDLLAPERAYVELYEL